VPVAVHRTIQPRRQQSHRLL